MLKRKCLLGATAENELVFSEFEITERNGYKEFTASFNSVRPFTEDDLEDATDYYESLLDDCYTAEDKYNLCERFDCSPSELVECLENENGSDPRDLRDCSLYPEIIDVDGTNYYFESGTCGQYDSRNDMKEYTNKKAYDLIHNLWDAYHLKNINNKYDSVMASINKIDSLLSNIDKEDWIKEYISENF